MIEIVKIKNPFDRTCRESEQVIFISGKRLTEYIDEPDIDYILNSNFIEHPELTYPSDGDQIVVIPHVGSGLKKILGMIAGIMLGNLVSGILKGGIGSGFFSKGLGKYLAAGAVMAVGGKLINTVFGTKTNSLSTEGSTQTYGWDTPSPLSGEGNVIGVTYGECIPAPQILETHIDTVNDKQYLNVLLCGGMGPIDEITDIKIGGNPIANYTDASYEIRYGTNDQEVIPNFGDTTNNQELSYELSESTWATQLIDGSNAEGLQITLEFPNGLYHLNKKGKLEGASVTLAVEYRLQGGTWTNWFGNGSHIASTSVAGATCYPTAPSETWTISVIKSGTAANIVVVKGSVSGTQLPTVGGAIFDNGKVKFTAPNKKGTYNIVVANNSIISASQNTAVRRSFRIDNLTAGKYEVRAKVTARSAATTSTMDCTTCYWTQLTSIIYDDFSRPNKVLVGIRILATSQLSSGMPDITWRQKRNTVYVWNPETSAYETRAANNPIWAAYDIYHQCRYLKNINTGLYEYTVFGVAHTRLDPYWHEWIECAAYADEQVLGTDGTTYEKRFEFDAFFDTAQKRYDAAQQAANVGHATIMPRGNNIGIVCDKPGTMTQVFGEGRTTMSSLQGTFSGIDDRATAVEVVFSDTDNDFKNKQFLVRSPKWASQTAAQDNPAQLQLFGVKRKSQAYREGMYTLANNLLITQFVDIGTDIDAMVCQYGDIVGLNHTVSKMGIASGRIVTADTSTVTLDKTVTLTAGQSYQIIITLSVSDVIVKRSTVPVNADTETNVLTVTQPFTTIPAQYDNYMFGEADKAVKPFRVVGIEKSGDLTCKLSLAEYVEGVYTGDLNYPLIDYTPPTSTIAEVNSLSLAEESYTQEDGTIACTIHAAWSINSAVDGFVVSTSQDGKNYTLWERTNDFLIVIPNTLALKTYYVKVCTVLGGIQSTGTIRSIYLSGRGAPNYPGNFQIVIDKQIKCTWDKSIESDFDFYELRIDANTGNETGMLAKTIVNEVYPVLTSRIGTLYLYAHNRSGKYSEPSVLGYNIPAPVAPIVTVTKIFQGLILTTNTLPPICRGVNFYVDSTQYFSENNTCNFKSTGGIYDIQAAFVDAISEGERSGIVNVILEPQIDPALIAAESLSLEMMDTTIQDAVTKAQDIDEIKQAISDIDDVLMSEVSEAQAQITTVKTTIAENEASLDEAKTRLTTVEQQIVLLDPNETVQNLSEVQQRLTQAEADIDAAQAKLNDNDAVVANHTSQIDSLQTGLVAADNQLTLAEGRIDQAESDLDYQSGRLDTANARLANNETTLTTHSSQISTINNEIALKANQTTVDTLASRVTTAETALTVNATQIALKASQSDLNVANQRIADTEAQLTVQADEIASKVEENTYNILAGTVERLGTQITQTASSIELLSSNTAAEVDALEERLVDSEAGITINAEEIKLKVAKTDYDVLAETVSDHTATLTIQADKIEGKVEQDDFDVLAGKVTIAETAITQQAGQIALKANQTSLDSANTRLSSAEAQLTVQANQIATKVSQDDFNSLDSRVDTAESAITQNASAISLKADKTTVDAAVSRVTSIEGTLTVQAGQIASKANQTTVNTLSGRVDTAETTIAQNTTDIATKASQSTVNTLTNRVTTAETAIAQNADAITLKANKSDVTALDTRVTTAEAQLTIQSGEIASKVEKNTYDALEDTVELLETTVSETADAIELFATKEEVDALEERLIDSEAGITINSNQIQLKVDKSTYDVLAGTVSDNTATLTVHATEIAGKVSQADYNTLRSRVDTAETNITQNTSAIALKANTSTVDTLAGRVTTAEGTLVVQAGQIASKASQSTVDTLTGRVTTAESAITQNTDSIATKVSQTDFNSLSNRVSAAETNITQNTDSITLKANKTDLTATNTRLTTAEGSITVQAGQIASKANQTTVDALTNRVTTAEGAITTQAGQIALKAAQTTVDTLSNTVTANKSAVDLSISNITNTVATNKTTQDGVNSGFTTQITQNANSITQVATDLASANTVIAQNTSAIQLRATKADLISLINVCPETITLKTSLVHITKDTLIDDNVIVGNMLAARSVTADRMSVDSLSAITANIGTLRTATTGARTEISDNLIKVYDANNVLRVRMGVW